MAYGKHAVLDLRNCSKQALGSRSLEEYARTLAKALGFTPLSWSCEVSKEGDETWDNPKTCGVSGCLFLIQSAITVHSLWLTGQCFVDIFTCGEIDVKKVENITWTRLGTRDVALQVLTRGET